MARKKAILTLSVCSSMLPRPLPPLTDLERDALGELSNIAMARAAHSLRQMAGHEVQLSVPTLISFPKKRQHTLLRNQTARNWWRFDKTSMERFRAERFSFFRKQAAWNWYALLSVANYHLRTSAILKTRRSPRRATFFSIVGSRQLPIF